MKGVYQLPGEADAHMASIRLEVEFLEAPAGREQARDVVGVHLSQVQADAR